MSGYFLNEDQIKASRLVRALCSAIESENIILIRRLIAMGADPTPHAMVTPLVQAVCKKRVDIVAALLESRLINLERFNLHGLFRVQILLHAILINAPSPIIELLLSKGANPNEPCNAGYQTPFDAAIRGKLACRGRDDEEANFEQIIGLLKIHGGNPLPTPSHPLWDAAKKSPTTKEADPRP